ncbi:hypothetical protein OS242_11570 [Tumebacillus sp. DT12]|uniref:Uncharacterized protein n=1 Tax=Tumebacillus lacus TaxID=2995335 RepID=A0ABT3X103_9BACL|nr:hypothetical protein [Tumebacillus lacus]MCX7570603.1 hypothetical protein [Tumebacillus lacus]
MKTNSTHSPINTTVQQLVRVDDGPKLILVDRGRILDEIKLGDFDTRVIKTHQGQIISVMTEATTYYRNK